MQSHQNGLYSHRLFLASPAPVKLADGSVANYIGVQVDVSRTTEGSCAAFADGALETSHVQRL